MKRRSRSSFFTKLIPSDCTRRDTYEEEEKRKESCVNVRVYKLAELSFVNK